MVQNNFWGDLLRTLRDDARLTQRRLSDLTGVNRDTIRRIERGQTSPELRVFERLLNHLGYEIEAMERATEDERLAAYAAQENDPKKRAKLAVMRLLRIGLPSFETH